MSTDDAAREAFAAAKTSLIDAGYRLQLTHDESGRRRSSRAWVSTQSDYTTGERLTAYRSLRRDALFEARALIERAGVTDSPARLAILSWCECLVAATEGVGELLTKAARGYETVANALRGGPDEDLARRASAHAYAAAKLARPRGEAQQGEIDREGARRVCELSARLLEASVEVRPQS